MMVTMPSGDRAGLPIVQNKLSPIVESAVSKVISSIVQVSVLQTKQLQDLLLKIVIYFPLSFSSS